MTSKQFLKVDFMTFTLMEFEVYNLLSRRNAICSTFSSPTSSSKYWTTSSSTVNFISHAAFSSSDPITAAPSTRAPG